MVLSYAIEAITKVQSFRTLSFLCFSLSHYPPPQVDLLPSLKAKVALQLPCSKVQEE